MIIIKSHLVHEPLGMYLLLLLAACIVLCPWPGCSFRLTFTPGSNEIMAFAQDLCWCD